MSNNGGTLSKAEPGLIGHKALLKSDDQPISAQTQLATPLKSLDKIRTSKIISNENNDLGDSLRMVRK